MMVEMEGEGHGPPQRMTPLSSVRLYCGAPGNDTPTPVVRVHDACPSNVRIKVVRSAVTRVNDRLGAATALTRLARGKASTIASPLNVSTPTCSEVRMGRLNTMRY
jgi:hypothetical protein